MDYEAAWHLHGRDLWVFLELDGALVLFQTPAGKTHFLNPSSSLILDLLADAPVSFCEIANALSDELGAELTADQITQLANHVQRLEALGLIAPVLPSRG